MTRGGIKMPWRLLGTVTNTNLHEPGGVTALASATAPRSRGHGYKAGRLGSSRWPCAPLQRVPRRVLPWYVCFMKMISWASWGRKARVS